MRSRTVTIVASTVTQGRCRYCGAGILWATTESRPGARARTLPFNRPRPVALSTSRNDEIGLVFETWPSSSLHFASCTRPPARPKPVAIAPPAPVPLRLRKGQQALFGEEVA
jgi:hypothetical protein